MKHLITLMSLLFLMGCVSVSPRSSVQIEPSPTHTEVVVADVVPSAPAVEEPKVVTDVTPTPMDKLVAEVLENHVTPQTVSPALNELREYSDRDVECLAKALYFEAGGEILTGMHAVGYVIVNRSQHKQYPKSICGVVYQRSKYGCQFSWVCDGNSDTPSSARLYAKTREVAKLVLSQQVSNPVGRAISFHNPTVRPSWTRRMTYVRRIGGHFFYA